MTTVDQIARRINSLPETYKAEVFDFVEFLEMKAKMEETEWSAFSLECAMNGMEDEPSIYSPDDLKEIITK